jgi:ABC-type oligopeptide transport system ATPase subunit
MITATYHKLTERKILEREKKDSLVSPKKAAYTRNMFKERKKMRFGEKKENQLTFTESVSLLVAEDVKMQNTQAFVQETRRKTNNKAYQ